MLTTLDGKCLVGTSCAADLINVPEQVTVDMWVNVYPSIGESKTLVFGLVHSTKEKALRGKDNTSIATLHIERTVPMGHVDE